jgi:hypothetical protein
MKTIVHHQLEADLLKIVNGEDLEITEANGEKITLPGFSDRDRHELRELLGFPEAQGGGGSLNANPSTNVDTSPAPAAAADQAEIYASEKNPRRGRLFSEEAEEAQRMGRISEDARARAPSGRAGGSGGKTRKGDEVSGRSEL